MDDYLEQVAGLIRQVPRGAIEDAIERLWQAYRADAQIFACGNGGSSATASHFAEDLAKGIDVPAGYRRFRIISLVDSVPVLTAYANDVGYEHVFSEPLKNLVRAGDVLLAMSGSGQSANVLRAMEVAREAGAGVVGLTGGDGGAMQRLADVCIVVPAQSMQQIEDAHLVISHAVYLELKRRVEGTTAR
ncbi:MAG: SIS domain-containing protein [Armatimonadota bacterium]|nr:MAG: SIS domain-containing protein [Armatimonadota bacterium]